MMEMTPGVVINKILLLIGFFLLSMSAAIVLLYI